METEDEIIRDAPLPDEVVPATTTEEPEAEKTSPETDGVEGADTNTAPEAAAPAAEGAEGDDDTGQPQETRSQRRRRERRDRTNNLERDKLRLSSEVTRLKERLDKLEAPKADDFENPDDYAAAAAAHATRKATIEDQVEDAGVQATNLDTEREAVRSEEFQEACTDARKRYSDFDKVALGDHWRPTPAMLDVILDSSRAADLSYYLGANPEEADRIARLSPAKQLVEMGKIEGSKLPDPEPKPKRQTAAPAPINPLRAAAPAAEKSPGDMTAAEYRAWRTKTKAA